MEQNNRNRSGIRMSENSSDKEVLHPHGSAFKFDLLVP